MSQIKNAAEALIGLSQAKPLSRSATKADENEIPVDMSFRRDGEILEIPKKRFKIDKFQNDSNNNSGTMSHLTPSVYNAGLTPSEINVQRRSNHVPVILGGTHKKKYAMPEELCHPGAVPKLRHSTYLTYALSDTVVHPAHLYKCGVCNKLFTNQSECESHVVCHTAKIANESLHLRGKIDFDSQSPNFNLVSNSGIYVNSLKSQMSVISCASSLTSSTPAISSAENVPLVINTETASSTQSNPASPEEDSAKPKKKKLAKKFLFSPAPAPAPPLSDEKIWCEKHSSYRCYSSPEHIYTCSVCDWKCLDGSDFTNHLDVNHGNLLFIYECDVCERRFSSMDSIFVHYGLVHHCKIIAFPISTTK